MNSLSFIVCNFFGGVVCTNFDYQEMSCKRFFFYHFFRAQYWSLIFFFKSLSQFTNTCSFLGEGMNEFCSFSVCLYFCEDIIKFDWELYYKRASSFKNIYFIWILSLHLNMQHHSWININILLETKCTGIWSACFKNSFPQIGIKARKNCI